MSVPTISSVTPNTGPTMGDMLVTIAGAGFRIATLPDGLGAPAKQTVLVLFDGLPALDARCSSTGLITAIIPKHRAGAVTVEVLNLDDDGEPIAGEVATRTAAFTYQIPIYTREAESDLARVVRALLQTFKMQLFGFDADGSVRGDVTYAVQTDYDPTTGDELHITEFAKLPGLSLAGPSLAENRFYSLNEQPTFDSVETDDDGNPTGFVATRVPYTCDLLFDIVVATNTKEELLNIQTAFVGVMHRTKYLYVDRANDDPSKGQAKYEFDFQPEGQPKSTTIPNNSNLRSFAARVVVRGFDFESVAGIANGVTAGVPNAAIVGKGQTVEQLNMDPLIQST